MSEPVASNTLRGLDPVHRGEEAKAARWTRFLVLFLRVMAGLSMLKGLFHWAEVTGIIVGPEGGFEFHPPAWQAATIFFAVIDLVAAVGLWLAAAWGAVVWLTAIVSMAAVEILFPSIYGGHIAVILIQAILLLSYVFLALMAARERPP
jgi:hypothetical protein